MAIRPNVNSIALFLIAVFLHMINCAAQAGTQADKAIAAVKQLISQGEIKPGTVMKIRVKQGNVSSFLGSNYVLQKKWEEQTGVVLDVSVMPQLDSFELLVNSVDVDLTLARNHEYPDLYQNGLISDLSPLMERFDFSFEDNLNDGFMLPRLQAYFDGKVVAIPADFDTALLFIRSDWLEDTDNRSAFLKRYNTELAVPKTWEEYQRQVEFFHRPNDGIYGTVEPREKLTGWMYWFPRYLSAAIPNQYLFSNLMEPLINSPAGVAATESYIAVVPYSPAEILHEGNAYNYTLPFWMGGDAYSIILTIATAKISNRNASAIKDKFISVPIPGHMINDQLVRRTHFIYGNNLVIPTNSTSKELAFLFGMWLTDQDNSSISVTSNGIADPYRYNHLNDERAHALYTADALEVLKNELSIIAPSGTGLPGNKEYMDVLSNNIWLAASGKLSAKEAMDNTAKEWNIITERYGREQQIKYWREFKKLFPNGSQTQ